MSLHNIFFCLFTFPAISVFAGEQVAVWGRVNMQGSINDTACAIAVDSMDQTIEMGNFPLSNIIHGGQGGSRPFSIGLVNCITDRPGKGRWKKFQVTFDGEAYNGLFRVNGDASGVALQIIDIQGNVASPGKAMPAMDIIHGDNQLNYSMRLVANSQTLKPGEYLSSILFKLDYF